MNRQIANFFWDGPSLSLYENFCLLSFVKNNFEVNLWTFDSLDVPNGVSLKNASIFYNKSDIQKFTQDNQIGSLAAFSDAIRYDILNAYGGWWFDTDCFCLKDESEFKKLTLEKSIIAGREDSNHINGAVLNFIDPCVSKKSLEMCRNICEEKNYNFKWGDIGPKLITELVNVLDLESNILDVEYFYSVHYKDALTLLDPLKTEQIELKIKNSFSIHLWNEILRKNTVNKNVMPPVGSFLYNKFLDSNS